PVVAAFDAPHRGGTRGSSAHVGLCASRGLSNASPCNAIRHGTRAMSSIKPLIIILLAGFSLTACSLVPPPGFPTANYVNIERFMGPWYVIAHIPPDKVKNAYNAVERYTQVAPGKIKTVFTYRHGSFDGERHKMKPTAYVVEGTGNAVWGMQFFWPIELQYVISYVSEDYDTAIIARADRDYVW